MQHIILNTQLEVRLFKKNHSKIKYNVNKNEYH